MITGIILAVLALLAIVFLIAFNIRASSPRKADVPDSPSLRESVHGAEVDARRQESMRETPGRDIRAQQKVQRMYHTQRKRRQQKGIQSQNRAPAKVWMKNIARLSARCSTMRKSRGMKMLHPILTWMITNIVLPCVP